MPGLFMAGKVGRRYTYASAVTSLPMFAKYARIEFHNLPMNMLLIKLKEPFNEDHIKTVKNALARALDAQGLHNKYEFFNFAQEKKEAAKVSYLS
jgi:hypothetical protein